MRERKLADKKDSSKRYEISEKQTELILNEASTKLKTESKKSETNISKNKS